MRLVYGSVASVHSSVVSYMEYGGALWTIGRRLRNRKLMSTLGYSSEMLPSTCSILLVQRWKLNTERKVSMNVCEVVLVLVVH